MLVYFIVSTFLDTNKYYYYYPEKKNNTRQVSATVAWGGLRENTVYRKPSACDCLCSEELFSGLVKYNCVKTIKCV